MFLDKTPASLSAASKATRLDSHVYSAELVKAYCVASVPNGGYVASVILRAAHDHLLKRDQTDVVSAHWQYVNKTFAGPAIILIEDTKLGRGLTVLHITLYQNHLLSQHPWVSPNSIKAVTAYITGGNISKESGVSLPTPWKLEIAPPPVDLSKLAACQDPNWKFWDHFLLPHVKSLQNVDQFVPREPSQPATLDAWVRLANGDRWTKDDLGFFIDVGPPLIVESYRPARPEAEKIAEGMSHDTIFWYPTIVASLETKKRLPIEGVEWLRYRAAAKRIERGRYDVEVIVFDAEGGVVALSHHVAMAVGMERNQKTKKKEGKL